MNWIILGDLRFRMISISRTRASFVYLSSYTMIIMEGTLIFLYGLHCHLLLGLLVLRYVHFSELT